MFKVAGTSSYGELSGCTLRHLRQKLLWSHVLKLFRSTLKESFSRTDKIRKIQTFMAVPLLAVNLQRKSAKFSFFIKYSWNYLFVIGSVKSWNLKEKLRLLSLISQPTKLNQQRAETCFMFLSNLPSTTRVRFDKRKWRIITFSELLVNWKSLSSIW